MIQIDNIALEGRQFQFLRFDMGKAPLVILKGDNGYVMCGYMNMEAAEKLGDAGVRVTGVNDLKTVLDAKVLQCTSKAEKLGIKIGDKVSDILKLL